MKSFINRLKKSVFYIKLSLLRTPGHLAIYTHYKLFSLSTQHSHIPVPGSSFFYFYD